MPTRNEWVDIIKGRGGRILGGALYSAAAMKFEYIDAGFYYHNPVDEKKKQARDVTAREMRKDGWEVKTESNSLGWFVSAKRSRK
jgi:hypothetical protein